jgi:hypothetical protein
VTALQLGQRRPLHPAGRAADDGLEHTGVRTLLARQRRPARLGLGGIVAAVHALEVAERGQHKSRPEAPGQGDQGAGAPAETLRRNRLAGRAQLRLPEAGMLGLDRRWRLLTATDSPRPCGQHLGKPDALVGSVGPLTAPRDPAPRSMSRMVMVSGPMSAAQLVVNVGTVKAHSRNLFGKLGVANRTQAARVYHLARRTTANEEPPR